MSDQEDTLSSPASLCQPIEGSYRSYYRDISECAEERVRDRVHYVSRHDDGQGQSHYPDRYKVYDPWKVSHKPIIQQRCRNCHYSLFSNKSHINLIISNNYGIDIDGYANIMDR